MAAKTVTRTFTEEELAPTEDEQQRMLARMALDAINLMSIGLERQQAAAIAALRHNLNARFEVHPMDVNGIRTTVLVLEIGKDQAAMFAVMHNGHRVELMDGTVVFENFGLKNADDKKKLN